MSLILHVLNWEKAGKKRRVWEGGRYIEIRRQGERWRGETERVEGGWHKGRERGMKLKVVEREVEIMSGMYTASSLH